MTRRKPLSKRLTALSLARNLTQKQEHQLVAMADRARHMEADLEAAQVREERVRSTLAELWRESQGDRTIIHDAGITQDAVTRVRDALDGTSEFEQELIEAMSKPIGTPAEQAVTGLRCTFAIEQMGRKLREQEKEI